VSTNCQSNPDSLYGNSSACDKAFIERQILEFAETRLHYMALKPVDSAVGVETQ